MSAHIGGKGLVDELLQRLSLLLFRDGAYDGVTHDIAVSVNHIGGGVGKNVCSELSRLAVGSEIHILIGRALLGFLPVRERQRCAVSRKRRIFM